MTRRLPPLNALRHFEAVARHLSFKLAAEELAVSPAAVTHQVQLLEAWLGTALIVRLTRRIDLTPAGEKLARQASRSFADLAETARQLAGPAANNFVTVKLGRYIGAKWVSPRLRDFWQRHAAIDLRLHHSVNELPDDPPDIDMAVLWGGGHWPSLTVEPLLMVENVALCAPALLKTAKAFLRKPGGDGRMLLHYRDYSGWEEWFVSAGLPAEAARHGQLFDDANVVIEAAAAGQGLALGYLPISQTEIDLGRLALAHPHRCKPANGYYLVYRREVLGRRSVATFRRWILAEAAVSQGSGEG
ncbi:MAG TPA: LysR family transcriptional regulator [Terriglobia bacterium]|nr:LysR family transcriptional regulator [Terriglobia bacterium]